MTRVLSVASECVPLVKTGGLADVVGALPGALAAEGVTMRTLLPGYPAVMAALPDSAEVLLSEADLFGGDGRVLQARIDGLDLLVLDAPHLYARGGNIYLGPDGRDWPDNPARFAALSWMAARLAAEGAGGWHPDILHLHDWQAGLAAAYLRGFGAAHRVGVVTTIHNIAFQGLVPGWFRAALRLPPEGFTPDGYEYYGNISALKAGLVYADRITTVSPTYARELTTPDFGMGFDGLLRARAGVLTGILNGIDTEVWNPATDTHLAARYDSPKGKPAAKAALRAEMGLPEAAGPLCVVVTRLTEQKGVDLMIRALPRLLERDGQLALLGSGAPGFETALRDAAARHPGIAVRIGYDEALSHRMIAGGDAILVPSRFEPCGLTQLYGLRYGTIPLVALTGGLADTIVDANPAALRAGVANGVQFWPATVDALADAFTRLCDLYADPKKWQKMQRNAMALPVGWSASAAEYAALYKEILRPS
jgi:starch synthase